MSSRPEELRDRTKAFACASSGYSARNQPERIRRFWGSNCCNGGTSVAANYRAVCRARSKAEFVARIGIVAEQADEAVLWLELLTESGIIKPEMTEGLLKEARELAAILTASQHTAKRTA
jgi:four helix bundle protein